MIDLAPARVRVPCSASNLGSGYDTIGVALDRHLEASFEPESGRPLSVERSGTLARLDDGDGPDLVGSTFERELAKRGVVAGGVLRLSSNIPVARGLGTSAAAVLAGFDLARATLGEARDDEDAFRAAFRSEGHGDNAAPSLHGGLVAVAAAGTGPLVIPLALSDAVGFAYAAPAAGVETRLAREILPEQVPHRTAVLSLGRVIALARGLADGDPELIRVGVLDELHVPHRLRLIERSWEAMSAAREAGAWAVTVSGAGSGLIALCAPDRADEIAAAMHGVFDAGSGDPECVGFAARPAKEGLERLAP